MIAGTCDTTHSASGFFLLSGALVLLKMCLPMQVGDTRILCTSVPEKDFPLRFV